MKFHFIFMLATLIFSQLSFAANNQAPPIKEQQRWLDARWIQLEISDNQNDWRGNWQIAFDHHSNNVKIDKDDRFNGHRVQGSLIVLNGHTLLAKGLNLRPGYEIDALDTPVLMTQLLLSLLEKSVAVMPNDVSDKLSIDHQETLFPIRVSTKSASALFQAPWQIKGHVSKAVDHNIDFQLVFKTSLANDIIYIVTMAGQLNHQATPPLDDDMSLEGWNIYSLGPETDSPYSYGAKKIISSASTISELKKERDR